MTEFAIELDVRWSDMDSFGHVNNAIYLVYLEQCRSAWLGSLSCGWDQPEAGPVVANININYRRALHWPARLKVTLKPESPGRSSIKLHSEILSVVGEQDVQPTLYADGTVTIVWIDKKTGESVPLPGVIRQQAATQ